MSMDGIMMHVIKDKLSTTLFQGRINKIYQISNYELLFNIRANKSNEKLLISCHPNYARVCITNETYPTPEVAPQLVMLLRKHLEGAFIKNIEQIECDRIYKFVIATRNDFRDLITLNIYIEIMGKHSNFILCDENNKIIECLKRISPSMNSIRILQPGAIYELPPMQDEKINLFNDGYTMTNNFNKTYQGVSPILSKEILFRLDSNQKFEDIIQEIKDSNHIYYTNINGKNFFHLIPLTHLGLDYKYLPIFEALDTLYKDADIKERIKQQTYNLERYLHAELQKNKNKLDKLEVTLFESENSDDLRIKGDLLFSSLHLINKGMTKIEVDNYYTNDKTTIELDPRLSGKDNAKKYYNRYQKAKNSIKFLNEQIELTLNEIEYFDTLISQMTHANYVDALEIKEELEDLGYLKKKKKQQKKKIKKPKFETYISNENVTIHIGKNNLQNDYLTFNYASKNDTWFHAKDMPGSHVVVEGTNLSENTIRLAASLASYYSKGQNSSSVPVSYTLIRNLKRPSKSKPGQVIIGNYKTIYIDPEPECLNQITKKE